MELWVCGRHLISINHAISLNAHVKYFRKDNIICIYSCRFLLTFVFSISILKMALNTIVSILNALTKMSKGIFQC